MAKEEKKEEGNEGREVDFSSKPKVAGGGTGGGACGEGAQRRVHGGERGVQKLPRTKEGERERISPSFRSPSPRPHPSFIHVSPDVPRSPLSFWYQGEGGERGRVHRRRP